MHVQCNYEMRVGNLCLNCRGNSLWHSRTIHINHKSNAAYMVFCELEKPGCHFMHCHASCFSDRLISNLYLVWHWPDVLKS